MALQDIVKKIIDSAQDEVHQIEASYQDQLQQMKSAAAENEKAALGEVVDNQKTAEEDLVRKSESLVRREQQKRLASVKRELVEKGVGALVCSLQALKGAELRAFYQVLIDRLGGVTGKVVLAQVHEEVKDLFDGFEAVEMSDALGGGFCVSTSDQEIDLTFDSLVRSEFRSELEMYFADQLKLA